MEATLTARSSPSATSSNSTAAQNAPFQLSTQQKIIMFCAILASLLEIIDTSIVNVAIPTMMGNLGATLEDISWVVTGYIIANAIVLPIAGWMGMHFGRRNYYTCCILLFTIASFACGLSPNLLTLIVFRVIQGFAGGALLPTSQAPIQEQFPREKAGLASAIYGMSVMIGPTLGPTLGGYLTDHFGWRMIFNINVPLGIVAAVLSFQFIGDIATPGKPQPQAVVPTTSKPGRAPARQRDPVDLMGLFLLALGIGSLQYLLERGQADDWFDSWSIRICAFCAVFALPAFIRYEARHPHPIVNVRLFKQAIVRNGTALMMALGMMLYSLVFVIPIFVSSVFNYTATQTGELFIPGALVTAALMPVAGSQLRKRDPRILIFIGVFFAELCILMMTRLNPLSSDADLAWPLLVRGMGMAFLFVPINTVVLSQFEGVALGQVAGLMNLFRQIGGSIGIAGLSTLLQRKNAQNYSDLASHISLLNPVSYFSYQQTLSVISSKMSGELGLATSRLATAKILSYRLQKQVFAVSVDQLMWTLFAAFALAIIPLLLIRPKKPIRGPVDAH